MLRLSCLSLLSFFALSACDGEQNPVTIGSLLEEANGQRQETCETLKKDASVYIGKTKKEILSSPPTFPYKIIEENGISTREYVFGRIRFHLDKDGKTSSVDCG